MLKFVLLGITGIVIALLIAVAWWAWAPDRSRAPLEQKYSSPSTRFIETGGTSLRVMDSGPKAAPVLLMLHGFGSSLETWSVWAEALSANYRVVRFDLPGSGLSEPDRTGDYSDARAVALTRELMDQLEIERAVLIGNSIGGRIAWRFAAALPERVSKLVLISPDGFASPGFEYGRASDVPTILRSMEYFLPRSLVRKNLLAAYADPRRLSEISIDRYYELLLAQGNRAALLDRMRQTVLQDPVPLLRQIQVPTLLLLG